MHVPKGPLVYYANRKEETYPKPASQLARRHGHGLSLSESKFIREARFGRIDTMHTKLHVPLHTDIATKLILEPVHCSKHEMVVGATKSTGVVPKVLCHQHVISISK